MIEKIKQLLAEVPSLSAQNDEQLEALRLKYLSKKGLINQLMADFRNVAAEQKREVGVHINQLKDALQTRFNDLKAELATPLHWARVTLFRSLNKKSSTFLLAWASHSPMVLK